MASLAAELRWLAMTNKAHSWPPRARPDQRSAAHDADRRESTGLAELVHGIA